MATLFSEIYERATYKFSDYDFLEYSDRVKESILEKYLYSAQSDFKGICRIDLPVRDDINKLYTETLNEDCIEILSIGIAYYWVSAKTLNSELMKNSLKTSEFAMFSPEGLLRAMQNLRDDLKKEFRAKCIEYSYSNAKISDLKV